MKRAAAAVLVALVSAACGPTLLKLPSGAAVPVPGREGGPALADAVSACSRVSTLTAEIAVSGSVRGRRVRGRLSAGVAAPSSIRLEAVMSFGPPLFIFAARGGDAALLLPRENRVLPRGRPSEVLDAAAGVPIDAADLQAILTGCAPATAEAEARTFGDTWQVVSTPEKELYLHRENTTAAWSLVATLRREAAGGRRWRADYTDRQDGVPRAIHLVSLDDGGRIGGGFDLQLGLSQVDLNTPLDDAVFAVQAPRDAQAMTLDELRRMGPFGMGPADAR